MKQCPLVGYFKTLSVLNSFMRQVLIVLYLFKVARRCWSGNSKAETAICRAMEQEPCLKVTVPHHLQDLSLLERAFKP